MMWPLQVLPEGLRGKAFVAAPLKSPVGQREGVGGPAKDPPRGPHVEEHREIHQCSKDN